MKRGSTSTLKIKISGLTSEMIEDVQTIEWRFSKKGEKEDNQSVYKKYPDDVDYDETTNMFYVPLTQENTLSLSAGLIEYEAQINFKNKCVVKTNIVVDDSERTLGTTILDGNTPDGSIDGADIKLDVEGTVSYGKDGVTFTPHITSENNEVILSWTNDGDKENPEPINIKGDKGDQGVQGEKGDKGDSPVKGVDYWTSEDIASMESDIEGYINPLLNLKADKSTTYTKIETDSLLSAKANSSDVYDKDNIDMLLDKKANINEVYTINETYNKDEIDREMARKVDGNTVYTKTETDRLLEYKMNIGDAYTVAESNRLLDQKADESEMNLLLNTKADVISVYTKTETDTLLNAKANSSDVYTKTDVYNKTETYNNTEVYNKTEINNMLAGASYEEITPSNIVSDSANVFENDVLTTVTKEGYTRNVYFGKSYNETLYLSCIVSDMTVPVAIVASDIGADISDCVVVYASRTGTFNKSISFDMGDLSSGANIYINNAATTSATLYRKITNVDVYSKEETDNLLDLKADKITTYTKTEIDNALQYLYKPSNVIINSGSVSNYSNANKLGLGQSYFIDRNITSAQMTNLPHYGNFAVITTINAVNGNHGKFQLFVDYAGNFSYRFEYGQDGGAIRWSTWHDVADTNYIDSDYIFKKIIPRNLTKIFRRVVCCGDSLTSGHIETNTSQVKSNPKYCWAYYLGLKNNAEYINCGISGASARTWLKKEDGLGKAYAASTTQAYIVAFGMNDSNSNLSSYTPLGTPADIGQDVDTFYCRYGEVIANLHYISPDAYIFLFLMPDENTTRAPYNEAIEYIGENYGASYNLHVVDLRNYKDYFDMQSIMIDYTHYHWTAVGYKQFAEVIDLAISDYILANVQSFQNLNLIDYTLQYQPYGRDETNTLLNGKADISTTYTKSETDTLLSSKANSSDVYTKTQADTLLANKVNVSDFEDLEADVESVMLYVGYDKEVAGLCADFENNTFTRIAGSVGKSAGTDFDSWNLFGGRRRCNVADDGTINAWYGDNDFVEDGSNGQVMVYQPKFYYRVEPLKLEAQSTGIGYHLKKANYYVSDTQKAGFKLHPAFIDKNGNEIDYIMFSAYEGCLYDTSASAYITNDSQVMNASEDKLSSIANVKPCSGNTQNLTRPNVEALAQNRGTNWHGETIQFASVNQLLCAIEYASFNFQTAIGQGVVSYASGTGNEASNTGATSTLGNSSGQATETTHVSSDNVTTIDTTAGKLSVSYRGVENIWGNIWKFEYGVNIWGDGTMNGGQPYICSDYNFAESKNSDNYVGAGFTIANTIGYVKYFGYSEDFDYLFIASEVGGTSSLPVGDYLYITPNLNAYRIARLGGDWGYGSLAGGFCLVLWDGVDVRNRNVGCRLAYTPTR